MPQGYAMAPGAAAVTIAADGAQARRRLRGGPRPVDGDRRRQLGRVRPRRGRDEALRRGGRDRRDPPLRQPGGHRGDGPDDVHPSRSTSASSSPARRQSTPSGGPRWRSGVRVEAENPRTGEHRHTSTAYLTMVAVDDDGKPTRCRRSIAESEHRAAPPAGGRASPAEPPRRARADPRPPLRREEVGLRKTLAPRSGRTPAPRRRRSPATSGSPRGG